jgi:hypothetical protein
MKFSVASAAGATLAAAIASFFGVKGTIIGVAIGSLAATSGTALVAQSIDKGRHAVQVVVRSPDSPSLLRRLGGTTAAGVSETSRDETIDVAEATTTNAALGSTPSETEGEAAGAVQPAGPNAPNAPTSVPMIRTSEILMSMGAPPSEVPPSGPVPVVGEVPVSDDVTALVDAPATLDATAALDATAVLGSTVLQSAVTGAAPDHSKRLRWPVIAGTVAIVFVVSLVFVTAVELIAGRPLANLFGGHVKDGSTTVGHFISPPVTTLPKPSTTTSTASTTTTSTSSTTSTTTTSVPGGTDTSSTDQGSTTTTSGDGSSTTSTGVTSTTVTSNP